MKNPEEVAAHIAEVEDLFGFITIDLLSALPWERAKTFLRPGAEEEDWPTLTEEQVKTKAVEYLPFAWEKANNCRGLSAMRSMDHFYAWLWLLGEDELAKKTRDYNHYGKPVLRAISEHFGVDWRALDDGHWRNDESDDGVPADSIVEI